MCVGGAESKHKTNLVPPTKTTAGSIVSDSRGDLSRERELRAFVCALHFFSRAVLFAQAMGRETLGRGGLSLRVLVF